MEKNIGMAIEDLAMEDIIIYQEDGVVLLKN